MFHQGYALKRFIAEGYVSANEIAKDLGISKSAVYGLYGMETLDKQYVDIMSKKGRKIVGITTELDVSSNIENGKERLSLKRDTIQEGAKYVAMLEQHITTQEKYIEMLENKLAEITPQPVKKMQRSFGNP